MLSSCNGTATTAGASSIVVVGGDTLELFSGNGSSYVEEGIHFKGVPGRTVEKKVGRQVSLKAAWARLPVLARFSLLL